MEKTLAAVIVQWFGVVMIGTFVYVLARAHFREGNRIDLSSLIVEHDVVTLAKFAGLLALLATTWILIYVTVNEKMTGELFWGYCLTWGGVKVAADLTKPKIPRVSDDCDDRIERPHRRRDSDALDR